MIRSDASAPQLDGSLYRQPNMKRLLFAIGAGILLAVVFYLIGVFYSGGGHSLTAMNIFFPYSLHVAPPVQLIHSIFTRC